MKLPSFTLPSWAQAKRWQAAPIGLELGQEGLRLVQFEQGQQGPRLVAAAHLPYPCSRDELLSRKVAWREWLQAGLNQHGFSGRQVVSCLPADEVRIFPVSVGPTPEDMDAAVAQAVLSRLQGEATQMVMDYVPIRSHAADSQREALVAVAKPESVDAHLAHLEAAGLEPVALEVGPVALARLTGYSNQGSSPDHYPHALLINFGRLRSHVSVIWGRRLVLDREIAFAESVLLARLTRALELDPDTAQRLLLKMGLLEDQANDDEFTQALIEVLQPELGLLVSEINRTLVYTASRSRGQGIDQVYLCGSVSRYPGVDQLLQKRLSLPVKVMDPFTTFESALSPLEREALEPIASVAVATGLALRGWSSHA